jgi:hypothetical protein
MIYDTQGRPVMVEASAGVQGIGVSTLGNTLGATGTTASVVVLAGSNNISLSQATDTAGATIWVQQTGGGAGDGVNVVSLSGNTTGTLSTQSTGTIVLAGGANITLSQSSNSVSIIGGAGGGGFAAQGSGTYTQNTGTIQFANSNGITFGLSTNQMTASHNGLTTARASNDAIGLNTAATSVTWTVNSSGISLNAGAYLTTAANSTHTHGAPSITGPVSITSNSNAWSINVPAVGLATAQTNVTWTVNTSGISINAGGYLTTAAASNHSHGNPTLNLTNLAGTTASNSAGFTLSLSHNISTAALSDHSHGNPTLALTNLTGTTASNSAGLTLSLSANAPGAAAENNWHSLIGNVVGNSTASGSTIVLSGGANVTLSGTNGSQIVISAGAGGGDTYTAPCFQLLTFGNSSTINNPQNSLFLALFQLPAPVSASSMIAAILSLSGTITSAATAQAGITIRAGIWSQNATNSSRYDTLYTGALSMTFWNSGTSSYSYAISNPAAQTTGSSAGSNLGTASVMGVRMFHLYPNSVIPAGYYMFGMAMSTSSAGYSAAMSRRALYVDNPVGVGMGTVGSATATSSGFQMGLYSVTSGGLPASIGLSELRVNSNVLPYMKLGAL